MACYHPIHAWQTPSGTPVFTQGAQQREYPYLPLPCGRCIGCHTSAAKAWALRCHLEAQLHERSSFATLTFTDEHVPITLTKHHLQRFLKRFRKKMGAARPIRFFASGEYGEQNARPHYHAILYGADHELDADAINSSWGLGYTDVQGLTPQRIAYTAGYTAKKMTDLQRYAQEKVDPLTGEVYQWQPPFIQMSRKPGIGGDARKHAKSWRDYAVLNGVKQPVPRFYLEAWKQQATEDEITNRAKEKRQFALERDTSTAQLHAQENIQIKNTELRAEKRKI